MNRLFRRAALLTIVLALLSAQGVSDADPPETPTLDATPASTGDADGNTGEDASAATAEPVPGRTSGGASGSGGRLSSLPGGGNVAVIPIQGMIYDFTLDSLKRRVDRALNNGATVLVIELDTYGGVVTAALDIAKFLKDPSEVPVPTVAWVNDKAYSAGIMIASACDEIVMAPASATGDCAPVLYGQNLAPTERAKVFSPIATEFKNSAARNGYTYATFHAMCVLGIELYLIENPQTGERLVVNQADYAVMVEGDLSARDGIIVESEDAPAPGSSGSSPGLPIPLPGSASGGGAASNKVVNIAESEEAGPDDLGTWVAVTTLPSGRVVSNGRIHAGVGTLFTPDDVLAADIGLSAATVRDDADLQRYLGAASVTRVGQSWSENLAGFLTQLWVRVVLLVLLAVGAFLELQSPGLGIPAAVAVIALIGLFGAPMVIGLADIWHLILFAVGLSLLIAEIAAGGATVGVMGIVGVIVMLAALVLSVVPSGGGGGILPAAGTSQEVIAALLATLIGRALSVAGVGVLLR
ncbi:MAG: hypothetical protein AAFX76_03680, partial [Planctomycetota bacterium]